VGKSSGAVMYCYSTGRVTGDSGGFCGEGYDTISCFWDIETSGRWDSAGGIGKTTAQMMKVSTYRGWEGCDNEGIWTIDEGKDYPRLAWEGKPGGPLSRQQLSDFVPGGGTQSDPYRISTAEQLNQIGLFPCEWDKYFVLVNDIDLEGYKDMQFNMIGACRPSFMGVFDGDGHTIRNFSWRCELGRENVGLFSTVDGQVKNLGIENVNISTPYGYSGGLAGRNDHGIITNCHVTGRLVVWGGGGLVGQNWGRIDSCYAAVEIVGLLGGIPVGGLVGLHLDNGRISRSYSAGRVPSGRTAGGLVGSAIGNTIIENCYSTCSVSDVWEMGGGLVGVAGWNQGDSVLIKNCYSTGAVRATGNAPIGGLVGVSLYQPTITGCFWDTQTSGLSKSAAGTGRTTVQMKMMSTFTDAGWDFVGSDTDGTMDIWTQCEGKSYPRLAWEGDACVVNPFAPARPVAHWTFDETSGTMTKDSEGTRHGTVNGAKWAAGRIGGALSFDGFDDYVDCGSDPALAPPQMTIGFWMSVTGWTSFQYILGKVSDATSAEDYVFSTGGDGRLEFAFGWDLWKRLSLLSKGALPRGRWAYVVATRDGATASLYLNGQLEGSALYSFSLSNEEQPLRVGSVGEVGFFNGMIDDLRIYDQSLSAEEVLELYQEVSP